MSFEPSFGVLVHVGPVYTSSSKVKVKPKVHCNRMKSCLSSYQFLVLIQKWSVRPQVMPFYSDKHWFLSCLRRKSQNNLLWPLCVADADIIFLPCDFYLSSFLLLPSFFSLPNLSGRRLDVYHTSTHGVALVRIENAPQVWSVVHAARWKCRTKKIAKKSPSGHHPTTLSGYIFAIKAMYRQSEKTC